MLSEAQIQQFQKKGFLNGGPVLSDAEVEELRTELARIIADHDQLERKPVSLKNLNGNAAMPVWQIVNIWEASEPYRRLISHPRITAGIAQLTGATKLRIWHDQIQYKPAEVGGVNGWHQDAPLWPTIQPMTEVSAWVALDDVDAANGCMSMVPGSHLWGNHIQFLNKLPAYDQMPATFEGHEVRVELCPVRKGEVHFHHALTWHGSHENTSGRPRRAIALHYMTQDARYVASAGHLMKPFITVPDGALMQGEHFPVVWPTPDHV